MSQMVTRNRTGGDEKEKRTDSPVKDMKKKMAANAEKEKNAAEIAPSKSDKPAEKPADKPADKPTDKSADKSADKSKADKPADKQKEKAPEKPAEKSKPAEKPAEKSKAAEKPAEKSKAAEKPAEKSKAAEKPAEKSKAAEKPAEKKDGLSEKKKEEHGKGESSAKTEKPGKPKQNGSSNGMNGTAHASDPELLADEGDETELFPELAYDDSDVEWEPGQDSRSLTRRSQVKATRTPETPRPASDKAEGDDSKESKVLKLSQEPAKDSAKSDKKSDAKKDAKQDGVQDTPKADAKRDVKESPKKDDKNEKSKTVEIEVVVEIEDSAEPAEDSRKPDTNFSKSRVKVSPYRRSSRLADQTASSVAANYTGNNTTMEMDITETSSFMDDSMDDSYLSGLRSIKGRRSYKPLKEMALRNTTANRSVRSLTSTIVSEQSTRPTAPVVGRKRKPELEDISLASEAEEFPAAGKRQRLLERLARPFRTSLMPARRNAEIVGINTDLPLTVPVASTSRFDPESLKPAPAAPAAPAPPAGPPPLPQLLVTPAAEDSKRCVIM